MLLAIKDKIKGVLGYFVIGIISIPFTLWGIQSYLGDDTPLFVASVNDVEITTQEFNRNLSNRRQFLQKMSKGKTLDEATLRKQIVEGLIKQRLLTQVSYNYGYRVSDVMLFENIKNNQGFQQDGVFDRDYYNLILTANNKTSTQYEHSLRNEMQVNQLQNSIILSSFATVKETNYFAGVMQQTREFSYILFNSENTPSEQNVTEDDINRYYEANSYQFLSAEKVKVDYIEIKSSDLSMGVFIDEGQVDFMYESYLADASRNEERKARHILLTVDDNEDKTTVRERLQAIKKQIIDGASFEELAKTHSKDPGSAQQGGDLDWVGRDQMVKSFENALFALQVGELSEIIETQFGFHLIKLDEIKSEKKLSLAEKRDEFISELRTDAVESEFYDITENLAAVTYENADNLDVPAEILNLNVNSSELFVREDGEGISQHDEVRAAAFSETVLGKGENSDIIEITTGHVVVLRVTEHIPAKVKPLSSVTAEIREILNKRNSSDVVLSAANAAEEKIKNGGTLESVLTKDLTIKKSGLVKRRDIDKIDFRILGLGFAMEPSENDIKPVKIIKLLSGEMALVVLDSVNTPVDIDKRLLTNSNRQLINNYSNADFNAVLSSITNSAKIYRNIKILEQ